METVYFSLHSEKIHPQKDSLKKTSPQAAAVMDQKLKDFFFDRRQGMLSEYTQDSKRIEPGTFWRRKRKWKERITFRKIWGSAIR